MLDSEELDIDDLETIERIPVFYKALFEEFIRQGFTRDESLKLIVAFISLGD